MSVPSPRAQPPRLNLSPLTQPVDEQSLTAFIADSKATGKPWCRITTGLPRPGVLDIIGQFVPFLVPLVAVGFFLYVGGTSLVEAVWQFTLEAPFPLNLVIVGVVALMGLGVLLAAGRTVRIIRSLTIPRSWWAAAYRITGFAAANQLRYGHDEVPSHPGVVFGTGVDRTVERRLTTTAGRRVDIGNYRYTIPSDDRENSTVYGWGYVAITLDRRLPHLLLDAKANNHSVFGIKTSNLPVDLAPDQRLSLGGEFDDKFTLYAPRDYGRDAFYIFAPDLMALFIDRLGTFDVEIVDDTLFVYGGRFDLLDPQTYDWLQQVVDTVVARTVRRTQRYHDDYALLEADPRGGRSTGETAASEEATLSSGGHPVPPLLPGVSRGPGQPDAPPSASSVNHQPVFAFGGDGPPQTATNSIAEPGRRLRSRRWGLTGVVGVVIIGLWIYDEFVAPVLGLPTLGR